MRWIWWVPAAFLIACGTGHLDLTGEDAGGADGGSPALDAGGVDASAPLHDAGTPGADAGSTGEDAGRDGGAQAPDGGADAGTPAQDGGTGTGWQPPGGGTILFTESFEDDAFGSRGWYDGSAGTISAEAKVGSGAFECRFTQGQTGCAGGKPARHRHTASESVYLSFWIRFEDSYVGSALPYHPHMFHFVTNADTQWVGPSYSHLTTYVEVVGGRAMLAIQDGKNVDPACILHNNDAFTGCNGDFDTYPFTEARSVAACNGLVGEVDGRDCFSTGEGWYSSRAWRTPTAYFTTTPGPRYQADWHLVEAYFEFNSIQNGVGVPDGKVGFWIDGEPVVQSTRVLLRTATHADLAFDQFLMTPYIGGTSAKPGSPIEQRFWVDELVVATAKP